MSATSFGQILFMAWTNWGDALFDAAWKGIPLLAAVWIATSLMKRTSASTRHLVWLSAMLGVLVLPILAVTFPSWQVLPSWPHFPGFGQGTERPTVGARHDRVSEMAAFPVGVGFKEKQETFGPQGFVAASKDSVDERNDANSLPRSFHLRARSNIDAAPDTWRSVVAFVWLAGASFVCVRTGLGIVSLALLERRSERVVAGRPRHVLDEVCHKVGVRRQVTLLQSSERPMPLTWGILKSRLLLPKESSAWSVERCRAIILHEAGHIKRWDYLGQLVTQAACALYWFNPFVWVAARQMMTERELACDDIVLHGGVRASVYAEHLLFMVSRIKSDTRTATAGVAMARTAHIESRISSLLDGTQTRTLLTKAKMVLGLAVVCSLSVPMAMVRSSAGVVAEENRSVKTAKGPGPKEETQAELDSPEIEKESSHSAQAADERVSSELPEYPSPATDADRIVAAARARTFGLHAVPRISLRETYWNADVLAMQRVPECSLSALWRARGQDVDRLMRRRASFAVTLAWDGKKLLMQTDWNTSDDDAATPERHIQCRYWDGAEGWLGEISPRTRHIYRYRTIDQLSYGAGPFDFPQLPAAGGRLPWPGSLLVLGKHEIDTALTRYEFAATETVDSVKCDVYDGPARHERLWIERSTGLVKAACRQYVQSTLPNYYTELIREVAGRTFVDAGEYRQWVKDQPADLQAKLAAHWNVAHWPLTKPGNLTVFSDYREIALGVRWPMQCERIVVHPARRDGGGGYKYIRAEAVVTHVAKEFSIHELARSALPQQGDAVVDRRFDPQIEYPWKKTLPESELQTARQERLAERRKEEEEERRINDTPIKSVLDAIEILTEGPKTDPTKVWARAIKYLVDHREQALPALIEQLDAETRDHPISKLAFALRAIGDQRAVPALIRALPRTLLPSRSDFGLTLDDWELCRFMQQHDQSGKVRDGGNYFDYGRAFREVISALHRLTGQDFGEMQLNWVHLGGTDSQRRQQRKQFHKFTHRWADWWERDWESMVNDPKFANVNLPPLPEETPLLAGRRRPPVGQGIKLIDQNTGDIVASVHESTSHCFVDLDTCRQAGWPKSLAQFGKIGLDSPELLTWAREEGFDLVGVSHTPEGESTPLYCLKPIDMYVWKLTEQEHHTLKQAMAGKAPYPLTQPVNLMIPRRRIPQPYDYNYSGDAFLFVTREGTAGLIRMTAQITDTNVGGMAYSRDSQFLPIGFYRGAKINFATMTEPSHDDGTED